MGLAAAGLERVPLDDLRLFVRRQRPVHAVTGEPFGVGGDGDPLVA
jgi:hypothetical protein